MKQKRHLLYVSGVVPKQGNYSPIIIDRHLRRLENSNWNISLVIPEKISSQDIFPETWQVTTLPTRRWWWPPVRTEIPGLLDIRLHCWDLECQHLLKERKPSAILTVLWDFYSLFAARLSKKWEIPLSVIVHDQWDMWTTSEKERNLIIQYTNTVLNQASRIWAVSPELRDVYKLKDKKSSILFPIPEKTFQAFSEWQDHFHANPVVAYAGSLHPFQISIFLQIAFQLEKINGTLLIIASPQNPVLREILLKHKNVKYKEPFPTNKEVINFLKENASCILVPYSLDITQQPWAINSFPSKLVEFVHLGLPVLIVAPPDTALSNWAKQHNWLSYLENIENQNLFDILQKMTQKEIWKKMAYQSQKVATNEFNSDIIQSQFESELDMS